MKRITIKDLADHAGVSTATVDRVLNGRDGVSDKSRRRVKEAIHQLGFRQLPEFVSNQPKPTLRLKWILPHPNTVFSEELKNAVRAAPAVVEKFDIVIDIKHLTPREHNSLINSIEETDPAIFDGVAVFAVDAPGVRLAINRAVERGLKVVTLISDVPTSRRHYYVGIDNTAAGRAAGTLMARFIGPQEGKIGVIAGTLTQRDHVDRLFGFEQIIRARCPRLRILPIEQGDSIRRNNAAITRSLVDRYKDLKGIYS